MDYKKIASNILKEIGGSENIVSAAHCATRLRLVIKDNDVVNKEAVEDTEGVKGVFFASGQLNFWNWNCKSCLCRVFKINRKIRSFKRGIKRNSKCK